LAVSRSRPPVPYRAHLFKCWYGFFCESSSNNNNHSCATGCLTLLEIYWNYFSS